MTPPKAKEGIEEQITRLLESQPKWHNCDQRNDGTECPVITKQKELKSALLTIFQEQMKEAYKKGYIAGALENEVK